MRADGDISEEHYKNLLIYEPYIAIHRLYVRARNIKAQLFAKDLSCDVVYALNVIDEELKELTAKPKE